MKQLGATVTILLGLARGATAADYPTKTITLIVPLAAGSSADILGRTLGNELAKSLGQNIVVDDRPGAGGTIAMAQTARANPDGYTMAVISQGTHVFNLGLYPKLDYDPVKDFVPITPVAYVSNVMILNPGNPARSVQEVIAAAKARPGELTFSSGGNGTSHHMSGVLFGLMTATDLLHVPYRGAPQGISAVMQGEVTMGFFNTPTVISQIRDGKLRALAVTSLQRSPHLPDVPTLDAAGVKGYEVVTWMGLAAPAGTPPAIVGRWQDAVAQLMRQPALRDKMITLGFDPMDQLSPNVFAAFIRADIDKWVPIVKASGATAD
jgi:tripartite-type tricarboxylate transporter receptor subunit TctC